MPSIAQLQDYLRQVARQWQDAIAQPPFTLFLDPLKDAKYANYAIPDAPLGGDLREPLAALRATFATHNRQPRLEFIEEFAPDLAPALRAAGFVEESRIYLMICTPETYRPVPDLPGLAVTELGAGSSIADVRALIDVQRQGFESDEARPATDDDAARFLRSIGAGRAFLARLHGLPVGAGSLNPTIGELAEVAGIATITPFRRRGIAGIVTAWAVRAAFDQGVELTFLTAADERAGRVYERVGFRPYAHALAYLDPPAGARPTGSA